MVLFHYPTLILPWYCFVAAGITLRVCNFLATKSLCYAMCWCLGLDPTILGVPCLEDDRVGLEVHASRRHPVGTDVLPCLLTRTGAVPEYASLQRSMWVLMELLKY
jgi:hypothetical protein